MTEEKKPELLKHEEIVEDEWMIRPCPVYKDEYKDCVTVASRFNQYFIYGEVSDCNSWKKDYDNCRKWESNKDTKAASEIIHNETQRRQARLGAHWRNDVWEKRTEPPEDWNKPLPEFMETNKNSYLAIKAKEMRESELYPEQRRDDRSLCVIM